jgi:hypothetical protein
MAHLAIRGKATLDVIWIRRALEVRHVTGRARGICSGQVVVAIHVAGSAGHGYVRSGQRKSGRAVIEVRLNPGIHRMAGFASCGEAGGNVIWRNRILEIPHVAGIALSGQPCELAGRTVLMASDALHSRMRSDQRETIFVCAHRLHGHIPTNNRVTLLAIRSELAAMNIGVAIRTLRAYVTEHGLGMTLDAINLRVHSA